MKIMIEVEVDQEAYDKEYGPGSEHFTKYPKAVETYKQNYSTAGWHALLLDIICEGLYDWSSNGWLKLKLDGKAMRKCCMTIEGEAHKPYCETIAGPETSA